MLNARRLGMSVIAIAALAVATLTGCSTVVNPSHNESGCGVYSSGNSSDAVKVSGAAGKAPKVSVPSPLKTTTTQVTQLIAGSGQTLQTDDIARVGVSLILGSTGKALEDPVGYGSGSLLLESVSTANSIEKSLACRAVGSRYVLTTSIKDAFGASAATNSGLSPAATIVLVVDVLKDYPGKANGANQLQTSGLPSVVTAVDGQPGIVLPQNAAPKSNRFAVVKAGSGARIKKGDHIIVEYTEWSWADTATVTSSTWAKSDQNFGPKVVVAGKATSSTAATTPWVNRIAGQRLGSQIILTYAATSSAPATVFVVDLLGDAG